MLPRTYVTPSTGGKIKRSTSTASAPPSSPSAWSIWTRTASWSRRSLRDFTKKALKKRFASLDDFLKRWKAAERKQAIIEELEAEGLPLDPIAEELGKDLDPFDLICHIAFDQKPLTRRERAENVRKRDIFTKYGPQARAVLEALLAKYADEGVLNLDDTNVLRIPPFDPLGTPMQLISVRGRDGFEQAVHELQSALYQETA